MPQMTGWLGIVIGGLLEITAVVRPFRCCCCHHVWVGSWCCLWIVGNYGRGPSVSLLLLSSSLGGIMVLPVDCWKLRLWSVRFDAVVIKFGWDHGAAL
jgi:hypothetical protein